MMDARESHNRQRVLPNRSTDVPQVTDCSSDSVQSLAGHQHGSEIHYRQIHQRCLQQLAIHPNVTHELIESLIHQTYRCVFGMHFYKAQSASLTESHAIPDHISGDNLEDVEEDLGFKVVQNHLPRKNVELGGNWPTSFRRQRGGLNGTYLM
jgi:hypothetical protein